MRTHIHTGPVAPHNRPPADTDNLGILSIDGQHQELLALIEQLQSRHLDGQDDYALDMVIPQLQAYARFHFGEEESLMHLLVGEDALVADHRSQHQAFLAEIAHAVESREFHSDRAVMAALVPYLRTWLLEHIDTADRAITERLLAQCQTFAFH